MITLFFIGCDGLDTTSTPAASVPTLANYVGSVDENATIGTIVGTVSASEAPTSYDLNDTTNFLISSSGVITSKATLDYETKISYSLEVNATNAIGTSTNASVTININNIGEFYIKSAVYDNNATISVLDDKLYIYFDQAINPASIAADMSINYTLEGTGAIGTASTSAYDDARFHQHIISLNSDGSVSTALVANDTNVSIASSVLQDTSGVYSMYDANKTTVEKFRVVLKTGLTISYPNGDSTDRDDGYYQSGKTRSYTDNGETVTDNATGLIWQKEDDNITRNWADAGTYCADITLDGNSDFRLPTSEEFVQLPDKSSSSTAINPIFIGTTNNAYWSSTIYVADTTQAWYVDFYGGSDGASLKTTDTFYVRCVR